MFACLLATDFSVQASLFPEPKEKRHALRQAPIAVLDAQANLLRVVALNDRARKAGIKLGMTKLQVETCSVVLLRRRSIENEESAQAVLLECASTFSPRVESTCLGTAILDLTGMEKLFGSFENISRKITVRACQLGFDLRIAIASNPDTALYAARGFAGVTIIPAGNEATQLAPLHVRLLPTTPELQEILESWGIHTFKSLAALPSIALVERLGQEGLYLQKLAQGKTKRTLLTVEPSAGFVESYEFEDPVETLESLAFVLNRLLQQVCARLAAHSLATNELRLTLDLEVRQIQQRKKEEQYRHDWKLPVPTQDRNMLFTLIRLDLERNTFSAPIKKLIIEAISVKPRAAQGNLFAAPSPEAEKLEITLARIRGVVGTTDVEGINCVGSPKRLDTHRPNAFAVQSFSSAEEAHESSAAIIPILALRIFRPALETDVELNKEVPHLVRLWKKYRRVIAASGPWCSSGNWWNSTVWSREEWDIALKTFEGVGYFRIYLDRIKKQWFVEGVFD